MQNVTVAVVTPKKCGKAADVVVVVESTRPGEANVKSAIEFVKSLGKQLAEVHDAVQVCDQDE